MSNNQKCSVKEGNVRRCYKLTMSASKISTVQDTLRLIIKKNTRILSLKNRAKVFQYLSYYIKDLRSLQGAVFYLRSTQNK